MRGIAWATCINPMRLNKFLPRNWERKNFKIFEQNEICAGAFSLLAEFEVVPPKVIDLLEQFVCHVYDFPEDKDINEVRYQRFIRRSKKKINPETLSPTKKNFPTHETIKLWNK